MKRWRLDAALRVRAEALDRAVAAHARAIAARHSLGETLVRAEATWRDAASEGAAPLVEVASLRQQGVHLRQLALEADRARCDLEGARRDEVVARDGWLAARRDVRVLEMLRDRERLLRRKAVDAAEEEELSEHAARCGPKPGSLSTWRREGQCGAPAPVVGASPVRPASTQ